MQKSATRRAAKQVASFALAYDYGMKDENGTSRRNGYRHRFGANRPHACSLYLTRAVRAFVTCAMCMLSLDTATTGPGIVGTVADAVEFVPKQRDSNTSPANPAPRKPTPGAGKPLVSDDDDIPF